MTAMLEALLESPENARRIVRSLSERQEESKTDPVTPMDTLGNIVDKLVTVNLKMWHNQETLYEIRRMTAVEFDSVWGGRLEALHEVIKRCCDLNVQRAALMDEIDRYLHDVTVGRIAPESLVRAQHKTY